MTPRASRWRRAYLAVPRELLEQARVELEPVQRLLLVELIAECNWEPTEERLRGSGLAVTIDAGETLWSSRGFSERHGVTRALARRFLEALERLGWASRRPALPGPPTGPGSGPGSGPPPGPPPTVVRVLKWRGILWPELMAGPPSGPLPGPGSGPLTGPVQQENQIPLITKERERASRAPPPLTTEAGRQAQTLFAEEHASVRGAIYGRVRPHDREADRVAAEQLAAAFPVDEIRERARLALASTRWPRIDNLVDLARFADRYSPSPEWAAAERARRQRAGPELAPSGCPEWDLVLGEAVSRAKPQGKADAVRRWCGGLRPEVVGGVLRLRAGQRSDADFLRDAGWAEHLAELARELVGLTVEIVDSTASLAVEGRGRWGSQA